MKICSWDIGITHLAYCIMGYEPNNDIKYPIYKWQNINLIKKNTIRCSHYISENKICGKNVKNFKNNIGYCGTHLKNFFIKNKNLFFMNLDKQIICSKCDKKAIYYRIENKNKIYYCKKDKNNYDIENNLEYKLIEKIKCIEQKCDKNAEYINNLCLKHKKEKIFLYKCGDCKKKALYTKNNEYYCKEHKNNRILDKIDNVVELMKKNKVNKVSIDEVLKQLINKLDDIPEILQVDKIIIENQPSLKNPKMKTIASALYTYFLMRGIVDKEKTKSTIKEIHFISPSNKLKVDENNTINILSNITKSDKKYKMTKTLGIQYCKQLIKNDIVSKKLLEEVNKTDKIDDLCDAMLQGAYYLTIKNK